jgi:hypothetical protein
MAQALVFRALALGHEIPNQVQELYDTTPSVIQLNFGVSSPAGEVTVVAIPRWHPRDELSITEQLQTINTHLEEAPDASR